MGPESPVDDNLGLHQALNDDYERHTTLYDKGHLYPVHHTNTQAAADSTFTLTNAAPQQSSFNMGKWKSIEHTLATYLDTNCRNTGYRAFVVTGVVPSISNIQEVISPLTISHQANVSSALLFWKKQ